MASGYIYPGIAIVLGELPSQRAFSRSDSLFGSERVKRIENDRRETSSTDLEAHRMGESSIPEAQLLYPLLQRSVLMRFTHDLSSFLSNRSVALKSDCHSERA